MPVKPGKYDPTKPDIELFDFKSKRRYGLKLDGAGGLKIGTVSVDDTVHVRNVGKRPGDFDEQRSWKSGRGKENLSDDPEGFWDSKDMWTLTPDFAHQTLLKEFAHGIVAHDIFMPDRDHSVDWQSLTGATRYVSNSWNSTGFAAVNIMFMVRKVGNPAPLTIELRSNSAGNPGSVLKNGTITSDDVAQTVSEEEVIAVVSETLASSTKYHIVIWAASSDNKNNHWEIGGYVGGSTGKVSSAGSVWTDHVFAPYYRVSAAEPRRNFFSFFLEGAMYLVDQKLDGTASSLWINGDRGRASSGSTTALNDTTKSWVTDRWATAWMLITRGTGRGQFREIQSNAGTAITPVVAFDIAPDSTSEYVIYATKWFTLLETTGLGWVSSQPATINAVVYFPQTNNVLTRTMVWNGTSKAHEYDSNSFGADHITRGYHIKDGVQVWRSQNGTGSGGATLVSRANAAAWASPPADLTFRTGIQVGDKDYPIVNIVEQENGLFIWKWDGHYIVTNDIAVRLPNGIDKVPDPSNGAAILQHQKFTYYSWLHSLIQTYGSEHNDVGQDWRGHGLPDGREGTVSSLDSYTSLILYGVNAEAGTSSVLAFDGVGTHEVSRAWREDKPVSMVKVQPCYGTRNKLWTAVGGTLIWQELPLKKSSPRLDSGVRYQHEGVLASSRIDMGTATAMPKFIKELTVMADNLSRSGTEILVEYQTDDNVHTDNWTPASEALISPESTVFLGLENIRAFAYRLIIRSNDNTTPVLLRGVTPNGFARTPYKMVWTLRCRADNVTLSKKLAKPDELMRWLLDSARFPGRVEMRSQYQLAHKFFVTIHPPSMFPYKAATAGQSEESVFTLVLEEI